MSFSDNDLRGSLFQSLNTKAPVPVGSPHILSFFKLVYFSAYEIRYWIYRCDVCETLFFATRDIMFSLELINPKYTGPEALHPERTWMKFYNSVRSQDTLIVLPTSILSAGTASNASVAFDDFHHLYNFVLGSSSGDRFTRFSIARSKSLQSCRLDSGIAARMEIESIVMKVHDS